MKVTKTHYEYFKKECERWIKRFELNGWAVNFQLCELNDVLAETAYQYKPMNATIRLNSKWVDEVRPLNHGELSDIAKHEVIHLLLAKLDTLAHSRYVTKDELDQAEHELLQKLIKIIN